MYHPTLQQLIVHATKKIDRLDAEVLLCHILKKPRTFLITHNKDKASLVTRIKFFAAVQKRNAGFAVAHITKEKDFFGLSFFVNKHTLIPRPDTELLVECALSHILTHAHMVVADIGTGSGCIPIAIKHVADYKVKVYATDISKKALKVAQKNAGSLDAEITFKQGDLLEPLFPNLIWHKEPIVITANLPYLTETQFQNEQSIQKEPKLALVAENEGLHLYEVLFDQIFLLQTLTKNVSAVYVEIDPTQTDNMCAMILYHFPKAHIRIHEDLAGHERILEIQL